MKYKIKYTRTEFRIYEGEIEADCKDWAFEEFYDKVTSGEIKPIRTKDLDANWKIEEIKEENKMS